MEGMLADNRTFTLSLIKSLFWTLASGRWSNSDPVHTHVFPHIVYWVTIWGAEVSPARGGRYFKAKGEKGEDFQTREKTEKEDGWRERERQRFWKLFF